MRASGGGTTPIVPGQQAQPSPAPLSSRVTSARVTQSQLIDSPSRHDGLEMLEEQRMRRAGCAHIMETIRLVLEWPLRKLTFLDRRPSAEDIEKLRRKPCSTACILFNRFYSRQSFVRHDRFLIATACCFLALKVEENHQKLKTVISCSRDAWYSVRGGAAPLLPPQYAALHQTLLETERCVMYTLEFDIGVLLPYSFIPQYLTKWKAAGAFEPAWGKSAKNCDAPKEAVDACNLASNLAFQMLATDLPLRFTAGELAAGCLTLALDVVYAKYGYGGGGGGGGAGGGGGGGAGSSACASPIKLTHMAALGLSIASIMEVREGIPLALAPYAAGDSAVRASMGRTGGVASVPAFFSDIKGPGGSGSGSGNSGGGLGAASSSSSSSSNSSSSAYPAPSPNSLTYPTYAPGTSSRYPPGVDPAAADDDIEAPQLMRVGEGNE